ncbi:MAG: hypothetical protein KDD66_08205 [Bdellovibrionales bacterium]|nr:hypothetical protein [Bdellovibrionales bacterium]
MTSDSAINTVGLDVIYWRGSAEILSDLIRRLDKDGFIVHQVRTLEEVLDFVERQPPAFLLVDGSAGENEASKRVVEISSAPKLYAVPIIFFGAAAEKRTAVLKRQVEQLLAINIPIKPEAFLNQITAFTSPNQGRDETAVKPTVFKGIRRETIAGYQLASANKLLFFDDKQLLPDHEKREEVKRLLDQMTERDRWIGLHARRTAFLSSAMGGRGNLPPERDLNIRTVSMLMNIGIAEKDPDLGKISLFGNASPQSVAQVVGGLREAASIVRSDLQDEKAAATLEAIAALVEKSSPPKDETILEDAQYALAAEMADRACWSLDFWNPRGAHLVMRKLRAGVYFLPNPDVVESLASILSQAVILDYRLTNVYHLNLSDSAKDSRRRNVRTALEDADRRFRGSKQTEIPLYDLRDGMTLSKPVVSIDGEIICNANVPLDHDMIWRLWQLAGVRPLKPTAFITEEDEPA